MDSLLEYIYNNSKVRQGYLTRLVILSIDLFLAMIAYFMALLIVSRFNFYEAGEMVGLAFILLMILRVVSFVFFKTYLIVVRYLGERDYKNVFFAIVTSSFAFWITLQFWPGLLPEKDLSAIIFIDFAVLFWLATGFRILVRLLIDKIIHVRGDRVNIVIFGAGELGAMLAQVLKRNEGHNYRVVAFFDDNPKLHLHTVNGIRVFDPAKEFDNVIRRYRVGVVVIGINDLPEDRRVALLHRCLEAQVKVMKVPPTEDWFNNRLRIGQLKDIRLEDLLSRPPIKLDQAGIQKSVKGKTVLVTGCAGSIGSEIVRQLLRYEPKALIGLDQAETPVAKLCLALEPHINRGVFKAVVGDIRDYDKLKGLFETYQPDCVFHAAAYKHVPIMEHFPGEAIKTNVMGTRFLADLSSSFDVQKFVMVSTDKVVNPSNVMGASKRIAEIYVQSLNFTAGNQTQFITTRFGNVLGSNGSVIPIFKRQIEERVPLTVTHPEIKRYFMTIPEACQLVLEAGSMGEGGEIFVFDMGEPVRIIDLAEKMIQLAGLRPGKDIEITYTGLRPGEKLFEELFAEDENNKPTHNPKIYKADVRPYEFENVAFLIDSLIEQSRNGAADHFEIVKLMKVIVPEFSSLNSEFSQLDMASRKSM